MSSHAGHSDIQIHILHRAVKDADTTTIDLKGKQKPFENSFFLLIRKGKRELLFAVIAMKTDGILCSLL